MLGRIARISRAGLSTAPVKEELVVAPHAGMQVVDLSYNADGSETALVAAALPDGATRSISRRWP